MTTQNGDKLANCGVLNVSAYSFIRDMLNFMSDKPAKEKGAYTQILIRMNEDLNSNVSRRLAEVRFSGFNRFFEKYDLVLSEVVQASFDRVKEELSNPSKGRMTHEEQIFASFDIPNQIGDRLRIFGADPSKVTELQKSFRFVIDHTFPKYEGFMKLMSDFHADLHSDKTETNLCIGRVKTFSEELASLHIPCVETIQVRLFDVRDSMMGKTIYYGKRATTWKNSVHAIAYCISLPVIFILASALKAVRFWTFKRTTCIAGACFFGPTLFRRINILGFAVKIHRLLSKGFNILYVDKLVCIVLEIHEVMSKNNSNSALSFETYIGNLAIDMTCEYTAELHDILEDLKIGPDIPRGEEMKCTIKELLSKVRSENFKLKPFHKALIDNVLNYSITCAYCICLVVCLVGCFITKDDHAPLNVTVFYAAMGSVLSCYSPFCQQVPEWENLQIKDTCKKYWKRFWSPLGSENECEDIK
ncbi:hypothetical protein ACNR91_002323 [Candidozyma auris]